MNAVLIDTNIYSHAMRGDAEIIQTLQQVAAIGITAISIGELFSGFRRELKKKSIARNSTSFLIRPESRSTVLMSNRRNITV